MLTVAQNTKLMLVYSSFAVDKRFVFFKFVHFNANIAPQNLLLMHIKSHVQLNNEFYTLYDFRTLGFHSITLYSYSLHFILSSLSAISINSFKKFSFSTYFQEYEKLVEPFVCAGGF